MKRNINAYTTSTIDRIMYQQIVKYLESDEIPAEKITNAQVQSWKNMCKKFQLEENQLFKINKWKSATKVLKQGEMEPVLFLYHNDPISGHFGAAKILVKIKLHYYWPNMHDEVQRYTQSCHICQTQGSQKKNNDLNPITP